MQDIIDIADTQEPLVIQIDTIERELKKLKNKKAPDKNGWRNEMLKYGGDEMKISLHKIYDKILNEMSIPSEWEMMQIKSTYKQKGEMTNIKNRRGLILTSIVGKFFEKVIMRENEGSVEISKYQNGGRKKRSTKDNWLALMAILDNAKRSNETCHLLFADAEKCFDNLWLEDCLIDLKRSGMREREVAMILKLNEKAKIEIVTPYGSTNRIEITRIVKQGTVYGPQLYCVNTDKVNSMSEKSSVLVSPEVDIGSMIYVDDIMAGGNKETVEAAGRNLREMEKKKGYTFNVGEAKTQYITVKRGQKAEQEPEITLSQGIVTKTKHYKFLGNYINELGNVERQIEEVEKKISGMIMEMKRLTKDCELGCKTTDARIFLYQKTVVLSITYNLEMWTKLRICDQERIERVQSKAIKQMFNLPQGTPYWGLLAETGIRPIQSIIEYHRMMFFHKVLNGGDSLSADIIRSHDELATETWTSETKKIGKKYNLDMTIQKIKNIKKSEWKRQVKDKIKCNIEEQWQEKLGRMKKLRHLRQSNHGQKEYLKETT